MIKEISVRTSKHSEFVSISGQVETAVRELGVTDGTVTVYVPHTTAGLTIQENADPAVRSDILYVLDTMVPWRDANYRHMEDNTAAHVKASLMGFSKTLLVEKGRILLGTWQTLYFCEFDGPRSRKVYVKGIKA